MSGAKLSIINDDGSETEVGIISENAAAQLQPLRIVLPDEIEIECKLEIVGHSPLCGIPFAATCAWCDLMRRWCEP